jgi:hypothetical protein
VPTIIIFTQVYPILLPYAAPPLPCLSLVRPSSFPPHPFVSSYSNSLFNVLQGKIKERYEGPRNLTQLQTFVSNVTGKALTTSTTECDADCHIHQSTGHASRAVPRVDPYLVLSIGVLVVLAVIRLCKCCRKPAEVDKVVSQ